jgi:hypothetical protein
VRWDVGPGIRGSSEIIVGPQTDIAGGKRAKMEVLEKLWKIMT